MMHTEFIAYATATINEIGSDAGISVYRKIIEDGILREESEIMTRTAEIREPDGEVDFDAVEAQLECMGYRLAGAGWTFSSGQYAIEVEKMDEGSV